MHGARMHGARMHGAGNVTLSFFLGRGQFATAVLREICAFEDVPELDADDD
jgi:tRNA(Glu) U13 pseudouridine synthase TruD